MRCSLRRNHALGLTGQGRLTPKTGHLASRQVLQGSVLVSTWFLCSLQVTGQQFWGHSHQASTKPVHPSASLAPSIPSNLHAS